MFAQLTNALCGHIDIYGAAKRSVQIHNMPSNCLVCVDRFEKKKHKTKTKKSRPKQWPYTDAGIRFEIKHDPFSRVYNGRYAGEFTPRQSHRDACFFFIHTFLKMCSFSHPDATSV